MKARLVAAVRGSPRLMTVLTILRDLDLPDWRIASGAVYQTVWNALTGRDPDHGLKDYDVFYFDPDASWDAEDRVIKRVDAALPPLLRPMIEVRNQARVHLWFEGRFGEPYAPLSCTDEALERFLAPCFAVAVRLTPDDVIDVAAPFGLDELFAMRLGPNLRRPINRAAFERVAASAVARWPELSVSPRWALSSQGPRPCANGP